MADDVEDIRGCLETLIRNATSSKPNALHVSAIMEIICILQKNPHAAHVAVRLMSTKIQSQNEQEALLALNLLDVCMKECGANFQAEVGKFRFLNELIKLVSPKYLGGRTSVLVRQKVLKLLYAWTKNYSHETKIQEAYDMLKKQGVISKEDPEHGSPKLEEKVAHSAKPTTSSAFEDDERSRLLQKLLQSKNPDDLQAANRLIKTMVKEDERRAELYTRRLTEVESVRSNARLLSEMLDSYWPGQAAEDTELIKEVHQSCERLRPVIFRLASETQDNEALMSQVLNASDALTAVLDKYIEVMEYGKHIPSSAAKNTSLLDLSTPSEELLPPVAVALLSEQLADLGLDERKPGSPPAQSNIEALGDIFGAAALPEPPVPETTILKPVSLLNPLHRSPARGSPSGSPSGALDPFLVWPPSPPVKLDSLEEIMQGENIFSTRSVPSHQLRSFHHRVSRGRLTLNQLRKSQQAPADSKPEVSISSPSIAMGKEDQNASKLDLDFLIGGKVHSSSVKPVDSSDSQEQISSDDTMVDLSEDVPKDSLGLVDSTPTACGANSQSVEDTRTSAIEDEDKNIGSANESKREEVKSLAEIHVSLDSIKPAPISPLPVVEERNGISVILHFTSDTPRPDVSVVVVTTLSKNTLPLTSFLFQAVVPKTCKLRLLPPSGTDLPAHNPFLPPSAITQVMLIANPNKDPVSLKFMISYTMDGETITEMGEVERLPLDT